VPFCKAQWPIERVPSKPSVQAGDRLLAINNSRVEIWTIDEALSVLQSEQIIRLKLHKSQSADELPQQARVVYTVELVWHGGPLVITISGTESPDDPIAMHLRADGKRTGRKDRSPSRR
jgi:hypothetical protein